MYEFPQRKLVSFTSSYTSHYLLTIARPFVPFRVYLPSDTLQYLPSSIIKFTCLWHILSMVDIHLRKLLWLYCLGYAGLKGNHRSDRLAGKAILTSGLLLGRSEVLRSLRHYLRTHSQGPHNIDRLEERGVERGSTRRSSLKGRERAIVNQTNIGTVSTATLRKLLRDEVERIWAFPSA